MFAWNLVFSSHFVLNSKTLLTLRFVHGRRAAGLLTKLRFCVSFSFCLRKIFCSSGMRVVNVMTDGTSIGPCLFAARRASPSSLSSVLSFFVVFGFLLVFFVFWEFFF